MNEALKQGLQGLGRIIKREDTHVLLESVGWTSDIPLVVALRGETVADVRARTPAGDKMIMFIFDPLAEDYTVLGISDEGMDEATREIRREVSGQVPVETLYQHVRGNESAFDGLTAKSNRVLHLA